MIGICSNITDLDLFLIPQGKLPWQPIKVEKLAFFADKYLCRAAIPKLIAVSQF